MSFKVVQHVETLIKLGKGDTGRLSYILEKLKNNRLLYFTDQRYLENILNAYPMPQVSDARILRETYKTNEVNNELKSELKFTYEEIEKLETAVDKLRKEKSSYSETDIKKRSINFTQTPRPSITQQPTRQVLLDEKPTTIAEEKVSVEPPTISSVSRYVQAVISTESTCISFS